MQKLTSKRRIEAGENDQSAKRCRRSSRISNRETLETKKETPRRRRVDAVLQKIYPKAIVHENYSCTLTLADVKKKKNAFCVLQVAQIIDTNKFILFRRSGRVGDKCQCKFNVMQAHDAIQTFKNIFNDKTKLDWEGQRPFMSPRGKYTSVEIDDEVRGSMLHSRTKQLVRLICKDIISMKMPLGKLREIQVRKGLQILENLKRSLSKKEPNKRILERLSSMFFTLIPHDFGQSGPSVFESLPDVESKMKMLLSYSKTENMLSGDVEITQAMYKSLQCDLEYVEKTSADFKLLKAHVTASSFTPKRRLVDVWRVDRRGERERFALYENIDNRKLLWHGTRVPNIEPILKEGLKIKNVSRGTFGSGLYFASDYAKSASYVSTCNFEGEKGICFMFLVEVALGKEFHILDRDSTIRKAPDGYGAVVGRGTTEPDPQKDKTLDFEGKKVVLPLGSPVPQKDWSKSPRSKSEYVVYKESQARLRYLLKLCD